MRRESEVVVGRQVDDRSVIDRGVSGLLAVEDTQGAEEPLLAKHVQLSIKVRERVRTHASLASSRDEPSSSISRDEPHRKSRAMSLIVNLARDSRA
jgi:hypothetical protein